MNYDILTILLILYYAVMFVFSILYLNDWRVVNMTLDDVLELIDYKLSTTVAFIRINGWVFGFTHYRVYYSSNIIKFYLNYDYLCSVNLDKLSDCKIF